MKTTFQIFRCRLIPFYEGEKAVEPTNEDPAYETEESIEAELAEINSSLGEEPLQEVSKAKVLEAETLGNIEKDPEGHIEYGEEVLLDHIPEDIELDEEGNPIAASEPELDDEGNPIEPEPEDPEGQGTEEPQGSSFDLDKVLDEIKGMKAADIRKYGASEAAKAHAAEIRAQEMEDKLAEEREKFEKDREAFEVDQISAPQMTLADHKPFQDLNKKYSTDLKNTHRRLRSSKAKDLLATSHLQLATRLSNIRALEGEKFDQAQTDFDNELSDIFGSDADRVMNFLENAADAKEELVEIEKDFNTNKQSKSDEFHREQYSSYARDARKRLENYFDIDQETHDAHPYGIRAYGHRLLKSQDGEKYRKHVQKDIAAVIELVGGVAPFDPESPKYKDLDPEEARRGWLERKKAVDSQREGLLTELAYEAIQNRRVFPHLTRMLNKRKGSAAPSPADNSGAKGGRKAPAPRVNKLKTADDIESSLTSELEDLEKEIAKSPILG